MKICIISPLVISTKTEILDFIDSLDHDLIVLPGNSDNHPGHKAISNRLKPHSYAFLETSRLHNRVKYKVKDKLERGGKGGIGRVPWLVTKNKSIAMPPQVFAVSPKKADLARLEDVWGKRTHKICSRQVSFAICGEVDAYEKDGTAKKNSKLPFEILINPTHTTRGHWNHLGEKLKNLSKDTIVIHVANNDYDHHKVTTNLRIYENGELISRDIVPVSNIGNIAYSEYRI